MIDSITWVIRVFFMSFYQIATITALSGFAFTSWYVPYFTRMYDRMSKRDGIYVIIFRELGLGLGKLALYTIVLFAGLEWGMISTGPALLLVWLF